MGVEKKVVGMVKLWSSVCGSPISPKAFFGFLASCKISGALAFLGLFGPTLDRAAVPCWAIYFCGAIYNQIKLGEPVAPATFFLLLLPVRVLASGYLKATDEKSK